MRNGKDLSNVKLKIIKLNNHEKNIIYITSKFN